MDVWQQPFLMVFFLIHPHCSSRCLESPMHSSSSLHRHQRPRSAKSVEDIVDRRVSSLSTTSGCSDCTTATLQGAKSYGSSFFSGDEEMPTPRLLASGSDDQDATEAAALQDNTSLSSNDDFSSNHSQVSPINFGWLPDIWNSHTWHMYVPVYNFGLGVLLKILTTFNFCTLRACTFFPLTPEIRNLFFSFYGYIHFEYLLWRGKMFEFSNFYNVKSVSIRF